MKKFFRRSKLRGGRGIYLFGLVFVFAFSLGCTRSVSSEGQALYIEVFSDFVFVGSAPYDPQLVRTPAHQMKELQIPREFKSGYQYVFHRYTGVDSDVFKTLITRLEKREIKVVSSSANTDRFVGGPGFRIAFEGNGFKGLIFNVLDGQILNNEALIKDWSIDDYVLVLERT